METLLTINQNSMNQILINKSKFIACSFIVYNEEDVQNILDKLKKQYADATHICYAYSIYPNIEKCFDDGEPQGTAGKPILDCIKKGGYKNCLIVVVRYFGGVKLGAGGLFRAYSQSASSVLAKSGQKNSVKCKKISFCIDLSQSKFLPILQNFEFIKKIDINYAEIITIKAYCELDYISVFKQNIQNILAQQVDIVVDDEIYFM